MSSRWAARKMVSPSRISISRSSMKKVLAAGLLVSLIVRSCRSPAAERPGELLGKVFHNARQRVRRGLAEPTDRGIAHQLRKLVQQVDVPRPLRHQLGRLLAAHPARRALAT